MYMESNTKIPEHVSIIMDGNGRWAGKMGKERVFGHAEGVHSVRACAETAAEIGVKYLSLFAFSEENWERPQEEVETLMRLMMKSLSVELPTLLENRIRLRVLGNLSRLGDNLKKEIRKVEAASDLPDPRMTLIVFLSYSGKWDILQAVKRMASDFAGDPAGLAAATSDDFGKYLVTNGIPDPDVVIRTSGEMRISNYMLWQTAYSEFISVETLWPDFRKEAFLAALEEYSRRDRRYGKVK